MAKKFLFLIPLFIAQYVSGQGSDSITNISISYGRNHGSWGKPGIYARSEIIELAKTSSGDFKISNYFRVNASLGTDGKTFLKDTVKLSTNEFSVIPKAKINFWLTQLNTNEENFTVSFIKSQLKKSSKKEIFGVAKKYDLLWMLKGNDAEKSDTRKAIKDIQNFYRLDSFIVYKRPTIEYDMIVIDSYNALRIKTMNTKDTTEYRCQFFEPLGQPIIRYENKNYMNGKKFFNLKANSSVQSFLPANSIIKKMTDINNIKEQYIKWYLNTVMNE